MASKIGSNRKPPNAGKGRPKGAVNKTTAVIKEAIIAAYKGIGGDAALTKWAKENQADFYTKILPRILPTEITGEGGGAVSVRVVFEDPATP